SQVQQARSYLQALEDTFRLLPKDKVAEPSESADALRVGSNLAKVRDAIRQAGRPLHIQDLLAAVGKQTDATSRAALSGSISAYVRKGQIFTRPAPNTFGLVELGKANSTTPVAEPPATFGLDEDELEVAEVMEGV
ncbi:MAG: hypothetical protein WKF37_08730, partial [Bryobacteraceae bacterium]